MSLELTREQALELLNDACPKCKDGWPVKKSKYADQVWHHERKNNGSHSTVICLATNLRDKYASVLNG